MINRIVYTALGDSLTVGTGAFFSHGFVQRYAYLTEKALSRPIQVDVIAKNGMSSSELVDVIIKNPNIRSSILKANILTITIGGNDLLQANRLFQETGNFQVFQSALQQLKNNLTTILSEISLLKSYSSTPYFVRIIGLYNPYPRLPYSQYVVEHFNRVLSSFTTNNNIVKIVNISHLFNNKQQLLSLDRLHPNKIGYQLIAEQLVSTGYYPFV